MASLPLPKQVFGHPWLLQGDGKMSKSKGNVIYADDLVDLFGVDAVRYFVLHEMPFENDGKGLRKASATDFRQKAGRRKGTAHIRRGKAFSLRAEGIGSWRTIG